MDDLRAGIFDITLQQTMQKSNSISDELKLTEHKIIQFLDTENVHSVMLQDYLKALGVFTENQRCLKSLNNRN